MAFTHGPKLGFEKNFCSLVKSKYAISMNSCTSALGVCIKNNKKKEK